MASFRAFTILFTVVVTSMRLLETDGTKHTDPAVVTKPTIEVIAGTNVTLPCRYDREVFVVYWYRGASSSGDSLIMYLDVSYGGGRGYGPQNFSGRYNMTDNYSLIIYGVRMEDEGQYLCEVSDKIEGTIYRNYTNVTITATSETVVTVTPRLELTIGSPGHVPCSYQRPVSAVTWYSGKQPSPDNILGTLRFHIRPAQTPTWDFANPRFNITEEFGLYINMVDEEDEGYYTCHIDDVALNMSFFNYSKVNVQGIITPPSPARLIVLSTVLPVYGVLCIVIVRGLLQKKKKDLAVTTSGEETNGRQSNPLLDKHEIRNSLDQMRDKIKKYKPEYSGTFDLRTERLTLGFFGPSRAGKTALIDSLRFALQGTYNETKKPRIGRKPTSMREGQSLTEHIFIIEDHSMVIHDGENEIAKVSLDENLEGVALTGGNIHCLVLVLDPRENTPGGEARLGQNMSHIANEYYQNNYKVVLTQTATKDADAVTKWSQSTGVALDDIHLVENYTTKSHMEDAERSLELLRFLWKCIEAGEKNLARKIEAKTRGRLTEIYTTKSLASKSISMT